jgi:hypothetical protein
MYNQQLAVIFGMNSTNAYNAEPWRIGTLCNKFIWKEKWKFMALNGE